MTMGNLKVTFSLVALVVLKPGAKILLITPHVFCWRPSPWIGMGIASHRIDDALP